MIEQVKKIGLVLTIAILFTIFVFATTNAIYERPDHSDFCNDKEPRSINKIDYENCDVPELYDCRGPPIYTYGDDGCPITVECDSCYEDYEIAQEKYESILFLISSIVGVMAILFGLYYRKKDNFWNLIESGFLIGGLISLFVGTQIYYDSMAKFLKPIVILIELIIVIMVTRKVIMKKNTSKK